jgi:propionyl-CoA carboxylase alpha chain
LLILLLLIFFLSGRVYAEDPIRNFLPSIGPLITYSKPEANLKCGDAFNSDSLAGKDIVRVDSGVYEGLF